MIRDIKIIIVHRPHTIKLINRVNQLAFKVAEKLRKSKSPAEGETNNGD